MFYIYVLLSESHNTRYVGCAKDINVRLQEHNEGRCRYTSGRRPWKLIHWEAFPNLVEARKRERFLKSGVGRKELDTLLKTKLGDGVIGNTSGSGPEDSRFDS